MSTNTLSTNGNGKRSLRDIVEGDEFRQRIAAVLPKHLKPERMAKIAAGALARTPKLAQCTPNSFLLCMLQLSQWGLEPDGRHAHLIPFADQCTLILDYKGIVDLVMRSGLVSHIYAEVIRPGDVFRYSMGQLEEHVPHWLRVDENKPKEAGEPIGAVCFVIFKNGQQACQVMSRDEIDKVRKASKSSGKADSPWNTWPFEMWKKTVFKRMSKWLPWSSEIRDAIAADDEAETIEGTATPRMTTTELAGMLDAPEETETKPEAPAEAKPAGKQPIDIKAFRAAIDTCKEAAETDVVWHEWFGPESMFVFSDDQRKLCLEYVTSAQSRLG